MNPARFFAELKRRNVYKVAVAYAIVGWLLIQVATQVFPFFEIPNWAVRLVVLVIIIGFPIALVIAWAFELTPEGLKRTEDAETTAPRPQSYAWIGVALTAAALSLGLFLLGRYTQPNESKSPTATTAKSIAVLPFENLSEDKTNAYFANGIQDEILTRLSKIADLKVISRTSTQQFQSKPGNIAEIAKQLGVATLLEGSVQKSKDSVRVNVQLIKADADSHLWAETYDRKLIDIFAVESEVAQKIAGALAATLTGREKAAITTVGTKNSEAYDTLLRGLATSNPEVALKLIRRAVELDPNYAEAWADLAIEEAYRFSSPWQNEVSKEEVHLAAATALRLSPDLAAAHHAMGLYDSLCLQDNRAALAELQIAHERAPNDASILALLGSVQRSEGKVEQALVTMTQAAALDPLSAEPWIELGRTYRGLRRFDEARANFDRALPIMAPNDLLLVALKAETWQAQGQLDAAAKLLESRPLPPPTEWPVVIYYEQLLLRHEYDKLLAIMDEIDRNGEKLPPTLVTALDLFRGNLHALKGERAQALEFAAPAEREMKTFRDQNFFLLDLSTLAIELAGRLGKREEVEREVKFLFDRTRNDKWTYPLSESIAARGYTLLGDFDRALPLLQDALRQPSALSLTQARLNLDPNFDSARSDPRFQKLVQEK